MSSFFTTLGSFRIWGMSVSIIPEGRMTYNGGRPVQLMATCLCDAFFDSAAQASVEILEGLGVSVVFPPDQTCCGQPSFNAGDWEATRRVLRSTLRAFDPHLPIVVPSGSCASMIFHGAQLAFEGTGEEAEIRRLAGQTWELADFIVHGLGVGTWKGALPAKAVLHHSCHCRGTESLAAATALLTSIDGLQLVDYGELEQCCGFGGAFSVSFPETSRAMGSLKLEHLLANHPEYLISLDSGCLLHLGGILDRESTSIQRRHFAEILQMSAQGVSK